MMNPYAMTPRQIAKEYGIELPDCGDSACVFGSGPGMRTNGGCLCADRAVPSSATLKLMLGIAVLQELVKRLHHNLVNAERRLDELRDGCQSDKKNEPVVR